MAEEAVIRCEVRYHRGIEQQDTVPEDDDPYDTLLLRMSITMAQSDEDAADELQLHGRWAAMFQTAGPGDMLQLEGVEELSDDQRNGRCFSVSGDAAAMVLKWNSKALMPHVVASENFSRSIKNPKQGVARLFHHGLRYALTGSSDGAGGFLSTELSSTVTTPEFRANINPRRCKGFFCIRRLQVHSNAKPVPSPGCNHLSGWLPLPCRQEEHGGFLPRGRWMECTATIAGSALCAMGQMWGPRTLQSPPHADPHRQDATACPRGWSRQDTRQKCPQAAQDFDP
ncbi:unnamed protein product [Symbiodinium sp. CCMP2456]|nr:unnamed protein product [Symbiodinium sp. CCMP2456]